MKIKCLVINLCSLSKLFLELILGYPVEEHLIKSDLMRTFIRIKFKIPIIISNENSFHKNVNQTLSSSQAYKIKEKVVNKVNTF